MEQFFVEEEGASLVEYALLLSLVVVVSIAAVTSLGSAVSGMLTSLANTIQVSLSK